MKNIAPFLALLATLLWSAQAFATPACTLLGADSEAAASNCFPVGGVDIPVGTLVVVSASELATTGTASISDNATGGSNTYTALNIVTSSGSKMFAWYVVTTHDMPSPVLTISFSAGQANACVATAISGLSGTQSLDLNSTGATGTTSTNVNYTTGGTTATAVEIAVGTLASTSSNFVTEDAAWTNVHQERGNGTESNVACQALSSTGTVNYNPNYGGNSSVYTVNIFTFQGSGGASPVYIQGLPRRGAG